MLLYSAVQAPSAAMLRARPRNRCCKSCGSQPQTGATSSGHSSGFFWHVPPASSAPHCEGYAQYDPFEQSPCTPRVPHGLPSAMPSALSLAQAPLYEIEMLLRAATHALEYVFPSQPHTGKNTIVHRSGILSQLPAMSEAPQWASIANEQ